MNTNNMTNNTDMKTNTKIKNNRKDKNWLQNPKQLKNPKIYTMRAIRDVDGSFHFIGGETKVLSRKNQHSAEWVNVDTRDFTAELRSSKITCR
jgi:Trm5-related predicted tRNA methylase